MVSKFVRLCRSVNVLMAADDERLPQLIRTAPNWTEPFRPGNLEGPKAATFSWCPAIGADGSQITQQEVSWDFYLAPPPQ